jgi:hypothetical protein
VNVSDKYDTAYRAAVAWMARNGVTSDRYSYAQLREYADALALRLTLREGTRNAVVNGMELVHTPFGWSVVTR